MGALGGDQDGPVFLDIDASLVEIHSENKEQAAPTYKGGFGFHPMFCFADATGEALSGVLRPGNAGSNTAADHVRVLDEAISQLPDDVQAGHHVGENASLVRREVVCRTDSGGTTAAFTTALRARNIKFFTSAMTNDQVQAAIFDAEGIEEVWVPALGKDDEERDGSSVCELTSLVLLSALPSGTRLIVRREPLHPGAQRSLFPSLEYRYWGFYTDCEGEPAELDLIMRAHAHVENHIARLKDSGLCRFPFSSFAANANWMAVVMLSADLVRWFQLLCCDGYWSLRPPEGAQMGPVPRTGPHRSHCPAQHRAHPRALATGRHSASRLSPHRSHHLIASRSRAPDEPGPATPTIRVIRAVLAKCGSPGLSGHRNGPAIPLTGLNRERHSILNDPCEWSGLTPIVHTIYDLNGAHPRKRPLGK